MRRDGRMTSEFRSIFRRSNWRTRAFCQPCSVTRHVRTGALPAGTGDHRSGAACRIAEKTLAHAQSVRALGVRIAMDDFGTGYSSLELSAAVSVRQDQDRPSFHQGLGERDRAASIVQAVVGLADSPGHDDDRGRRRDPRTARPRPQAGLYRCTGLLLQSAGPAPRSGQNARRAIGSPDSGGLTAGFPIARLIPAKRL